MRPLDPEIDLSVVVTIVDAGAALAQCLGALQDEAATCALEVIVPYDASLDLSDLERELPEVRFLPIGAIEPAAGIESAAGQHELFDKRRSAGLAVSGGRLIAIIEDRGVPRPGWAKAMIRAHERPNLVVGGAVQNGIDRIANWAVFFCDFGRYQPPLPEGPAGYATDVNIAYKRRALEQTEELWRERYHETTVHWALQRSGEELYLDPAVVVEEHRRATAVVPMLSERFHWGRLFAYTLAREKAVAERALLVVKSLLLPAVLFLRHLRLQLGKKTSVGRLVATAPLVLALLVCWSLGETVGYVTRRP